ncbi:MAG: UPF0323 family lipoprotein [Campylobacteraceae bacterium]|jgi:bifunctional DNA-binding transcriptional regulator/antitoxin component of YhaV-PrlF toxin-antitoxin module|nr:UPF0323 family lipoprotein [Campylobacteraceae bacterium]
MKHIRKISDYAIAGGIGAVAVFGILGCESSENRAQEQGVKQGAFVIIEEGADGSYKILEEYPSSVTRVVLKDKNGVERILSEDEINELLKAESEKIDSGTSSLTNSQISSGMPSLASVILSSAAGAIIGSWIGNKLFGNSNYQQRRQASYKSPQTYSRSVDSFNKANPTSTKSTTSKSGGFFGGGSKNSGSSSSYGG